MIKTINVTQRDIKLGIPYDGNACPVYRASRRVCKGVVGVSHNYIWFDYENMLRSRLPDNVADWVKAFDHRNQSESISFKIEIPDGVKCD